MYFCNAAQDAFPKSPHAGWDLTESPYNSKGIYEAVNVIGIFNTESTTTQLAEIGYTLSADNIIPYNS